MAWGKGGACQLLLWCTPSPMALVHSHLHGAISETVAPPSGPPPYGPCHFTEHCPLLTTTWLFWAHQLILSLRSKGISSCSLSFTHHLGLSRDLVLPLAFPELICAAPILWWCKDLLPGCHLTFIVSAMGFKSQNSKREHSHFSFLHLCSDSPNMKAMHVAFSSCLVLSGARACWCGKTSMNISEYSTTDSS